MAGENKISPTDRQFPFDRKNLKARREYGGTNYEAYALPGVANDEEGWQISVVTREVAAPFEILTRDYAQDDNNVEDNSYSYVWDDRASYTYGV